MGLSLYDICGEPHSVFARKQANGEIEVEAWNESDEVVYREISHPYAWESLVSFARMVLQQDEQLKNA